ncbi:MAG: cobalamin biosynthesis protein [Clostridium sp.]|nr:cobalamin biosynthesis protein [Clostridium sp.]
MKGTVKACVDAYFEQVDAIVFVTASGIAVRSVAEHLAHKSEDPAIVCMDECGKHVISLVSGHAGGANALTQMLADVMWATPVITTATDVEGRFSIDEYAREHNLVVTDWAKAKAISAEVLAAGAEPVWVDEAAGSQEEEKNECEIGKEQKSTGIDVGKIENDGCKNEVDGCGNRVGGCENRIDGCGNRVDGCGNRINVKRLQIGSHQVIITPQDGSVDVQTLQLIPRCIVAGVGCKKGTPVDKIEHAVQDAFAKAGLRMEALCAVVSIDLKKEEAGLLEFCETRNVPFETYAAEELQAVPGTYSASEFVSGVTGVDNVCERSAVKYASEHGMKQDQPLPGRQAKHGELLIRKQAQDGELLLRKQAYGGVTVALAYVCSE